MQDRDVLNRVSELAFASFERRPEKLLVYAEVEDGVWSADLFGEVPGVPKVVFRFAPSELGRLVHQYWEAGGESVKPRSWATFKMVVEGSQFKLDFTYPADLVKDEDLAERRPRVVEEVFPGKSVDYANPGRR
jgi:hypothetical protein